MSEPDSVEMASRRLALALDALEAAAERRQDTDRNETALAGQIHALDSDRARLASELDQATARARGLENANREVALRIDGAIEVIRGVLGGDATNDEPGDATDDETEGESDAENDEETDDESDGETDDEDDEETDDENDD
jgi:hypothetical protein